MAALSNAWDAAKKGISYAPFLEKLHYFQLLEIAHEKSDEVNNVRIVASGTGGKACRVCEELGEKVFRLDSELDLQTLPNKNCTCTAYSDDQTGFCLCYYEFVYDDEL